MADSLTVRRFGLSWLTVFLFAGGTILGGPYGWEIYRANTDGSNVQEVVSSVQGRAVGSIAIDPEPGIPQLYWAALREQVQGGSIRTASANGDGIEEIFAFGDWPYFLAIDPVNDTIYFTSTSDCEPCGATFRMNLDGSDVEQLNLGESPGALVAHPAGGKIYYYNEGAIRSANLDGTGMQVVVSGTDTYALGMALDPGAGKLYWTNWNRVRRVNLDGSDVEDVVTGLEEAWGLTLDPASGTMWWVDRAAGKIQRADLDGANVQDVLTGLDRAKGVAFLDGAGHPTGDKLYFVTGPMSADVPATSGWGVVGLAALVSVVSTALLFRRP